MILDLHVHTVLSGDAKPTAGEYAERAMELRENYGIDGFVITEHRYWSESRYEELADLSMKTGLVILQGVELETDYGHILVYGVTPEFVDKVDISTRTNGLAVVETALATGGFPVPAHPGRPMVGCGIALRALNGIRAIEHLNGGNNEAENRRAQMWMEEFGLYGIGGSDAHFINDLGICLTAFENSIRDDAGLAKELANGNYHAIHLKEAKGAR